MASSPEQQKIQALEAQVATLKRHLQDQRRFLRQFSQHAPAAIAMFDRDMRYLMVSDRWLESYRLADQDLIGRHHYEVFPEIPERWKAVHRRCLKGVIESCEGDPFERADGRLDYVNWVVAPWYKENEEVGGLIFYTEVVTEQVEARQRTRQLHQELKASHQRLEEYATAITRAAEELITAGIEAAESLSEPKLAANPEAVGSQGMHLAASLRRLRRLIDGLQAFTQVGNHTGYHTVDLNTVVTAVVGELSPLVNNTGAQVAFDPLPAVTANEFEMIALFQNLIGNALLYHGPGLPRIQVRVSQEAGYYVFSVEDNGPGIPAELHQEIFHLFRRQDLDPAHQGIGISLPVCKRIVEAMGGRIWIEAVEGQGTKVFFTLPQP
ncbi:MAG: PAS domain-containing sensor histidine kinase [Bacteroidetes bacterium]|nr:MAG: PAS domain-containing sensor histidine kinase [Bacteroidota bacterium]